MRLRPTFEEENARRPSRERESLVGERTRIINRIKAVLAWLGIRGFNPKLRRAVECLDAMRDNAWCAAATQFAMIREQIKESRGHASRVWNKRR